MNNDELRDVIRWYTYIDESTLNNIAILEGDEFADGCVGITSDNHLIYDYQKLAESISKKDNMTIEDAKEFIDYNTLRTLPYIKNQGYLEPVIMYGFWDSDGDI